MPALRSTSRSCQRIRFSLWSGQADERLGQPGDGLVFPHGIQAVGSGGTVEAAQQLRQREGAPTFGSVLLGLAAVLEPLHVSIHDAESVATQFVGIGLFELHQIALTDVPGVAVAQVAAEQVQGERVAFHILDQFLELIPKPPALGDADVFPETSLHPAQLEQLHPRSRGTALELFLPHGSSEGGAQVRDGIAGGDDAQAVPLATALWSVMESVTFSPSLTRMMRLPR
jgi:hypothetical protein